MKKRAVTAAVGVALGGAALMVSMQGTAQAIPAAPANSAVVTAKSATPGDQSPKVIGSVAAKAAKAAGKAAVHAKAAAGSGASNNSLIGSLWGLRPANVSDASVASAETVFDR